MWVILVTALTEILRKDFRTHAALEQEVLMNVAERSWQTGNSSSSYRSVQYQKEKAGTVAKPVKDSKSDVDLEKELEDSVRVSEELAEKASDSQNQKIRSSAPKDSVGQLASELARSETKLDVLQVLSKATRALASLKMSAYGCEGKEAKKAAQMIRRMEKLIKRIQKKVKQLSKEEQIKLQQKKAEKEQEAQRAKQLREELQSRRRRRRRDERDYAMKELAEDGRESVNETLNSVIGASAALSGSPNAVYNASGGIDLSSVSMDGMSVDISV